ncbi:MAG: hypothetical protein J5997_02415 [Oscillospiraceae bacterium]|nr:hypothetical protein [Oscillospiraceae bacterium]
MTKQEIIGVINEAVPKIKTDIFKEEGDKKNIGCNQFRELANICRHSDCYEEIEMLIRYNEAKCIENKKGVIVRSSWAAYMKDGKTSLASLLRCCMNTIRDRSENEESCMQNLSLLFGYFYWNARIWAAENKVAQNNAKDDDNKYRNNNNGLRNNGNNDSKSRGRKW